MPVGLIACFILKDPPADLPNHATVVSLTHAFVKDDDEDF